MKVLFFSEVGKELMKASASSDVVDAARLKSKIRFSGQGRLFGGVRFAIVGVTVLFERCYLGSHSG